jgi:hypothetical protein
MKAYTAGIKQLSVSGISIWIDFSSRRGGLSNEIF